MALALAGNKPPLLLLLLLFSVTCSYGNQNQQFINSCGDIHNISFPFQLQGDPSITCNDNDFTLLCEDNRTVLHLFSRKYYVKSINYTDSSIRLVDVGFQSNDICSSFPPSSLTFRDFYQASVPYVVPYGSYVMFLRCENPVQSPRSYINKTGYCNSSRDNSGNGYYSYVVAGDVGIWDVADSCLLEVFYLSSSPLIRERGSNLSWLDLYKELGYGFVAWFGSYGGCNRCKERASCFGDSVNVTAVCRYLCSDSYSYSYSHRSELDLLIPYYLF
ncbi:hypothetical protein RHSIM_Rhsim03G0201500 [Rhododendron simsii]|uniref:Wall-associated receptor kinase galacturonan-binding domain-containing protein n=1 Tax=Rhododendron simsii TaxID=118357 RepID=A0A834H4T7_RHOSS|nr:hypothetical protein RHSIM_Rhsim03G0201500 [Rhododendron simsii]